MRRGDCEDATLKLRWNYAQSLSKNPNATLDDVREAVTTLEDTAQIARRVLGGANPLVAHTEDALRESRASLRARETPSA